MLDISFANRRLRAGAEASEHRYRELFDGSPEAVLVQSIDRIVLDANPAARRLYGDDLIGRDVDELVGDGEDRTTIDDAGVAHYTGTGHRLDGSTFPEEVDVRWIELGGEPRMLSIVRDLTERSRLQAELVQAQKMEAIGLLVAGVAHELNNPLASIVAFSQLLRTDPVLPEDLRTQADRLVQEANRTRTIVDNLLDFARQRPPERVPTDLRALVESTLGLQSYLLTRGRLTVEVDIPADLPLVMVDRSQLQQVLVNLTVNAAQAIDAENRPGRITIRASRIAGAGDGDGEPDRPDHDRRRRPGHPAGDPRPPVRAVRHDEAAGRRHRARPVGLVRDRRRPRRDDPPRGQRRRRGDLRDRAAGDRGGRDPRAADDRRPLRRRPGRRRDDRRPARARIRAP